MLLVLLVVPAIAGADEPNEMLTEAKAFFKKFVAMEQAYDARTADLYDDSAVLITDRKYPTGQMKTISIPASTYKPLLRNLMPVMKLRGDWSQYSETTYEIEADKVRIRSTRKSMLKGYSGPHSLLVGRNTAGEWRIFEERAYSQPF